jgi:hypothetical protein
MSFATNHVIRHPLAQNAPLYIPDVHQELTLP